MKISCVILLFAVITATVVCSDAEFRGLRIIDASGNTQTNAGRLEVSASINGVEQWGSICDDGFNNNSANTACHYLGFDGAISWADRGLIPGTGPILLDQVSCDYIRNSINECPHNPLGVHDCQHSEDVSITCRPSALRLVNQNGAVAQNEGWVEVSYDFRWGSVCVNRDPLTTSNVAAVVCRQLGLPAPTSSDSNTGYPGISVTNYGDISCPATAASVQFCGRIMTPRSNFQNTCNRSGYGYLYVTCGNPTPPSASQPPVLPSPSAASSPSASRPAVLPSASASPTNGIPALRLTNFANLVGEGYVEVWKNNRWGSVCANGLANWAQNAGSVVCRQLGLAGVRTAVVDTGTLYLQAPLPNYGALSCGSGNEPNVLAPSCTRADEATFTTCNEDHFGYLYVTCLKSFLSQKEEVEAESILNGNYSSQNVIMGSSLVGVAILVTAFIVRKRRAATAANVVNKAIPLAENDQMKETI